MTRLPTTTIHRIAPYAVALLTPILALAASWLLIATVRNIPLIFFIVAVLLSAWYGGFKPGILCALLSLFLMDYFVLEPRFVLLSDASDIPVLGAFLLVAIVISSIEERRLRTEQALRQSRDQLGIILQGITDGVTAQDVNGEVLFTNEAAARMAGFPNAEAMMATPINKIRSRYEIFEENGSPLAYDKLPTRRAFVEGISSQITYKWHLLEEGKNRWMNFKSTPVFDAQGKVQMSINILTDITEEKTSEVSLRHTHERLQTILANIKSAVISTDTEGRIDRLNPSAEILTGWTEAQAIGRPFEDVVMLTGEKPNEVIQSPIRTVLREGSSIDINYAKSTQLITKDGDEISIEYNATPLKDQFKSIMGAIMVFRDISDRLKAEKDRTQLMLLLAAQQKRLENILANIPGIIWESSIGKDGQPAKMDFVNDSVEKILGYSREEWLADPSFGQSIIHPDDVESSAAEARALYESGNLTSSIQFRCVAKDGRIVPMEAYYTILRDAEGNITGNCGLLMDISQRKANENALRQSTQDLQRSNEQLEQFAYVASHDLQEPLRMITSYLQLLERRYKDQLDADANEFIGYAVDGSSRMKSLINDLLAYSRVKTGEQNFKPFSMQSVVTQVVNNLQMSIEEAGADITFEKLPTINGDEAQFVQLFQNLLSNAIKFHSTTKPQVAITAERRGKEWKFCVRDNGIGMEPQYLERIFVIFQRLHSKEQYPGTGIGLAICKKVVEHHGGRIWAESTPGIGTTFWFTIPVR